MELSIYFKSVVDADNAPIVICNINHEIIYMNPAAISRYQKRGGSELLGKSLMYCHNNDSNEKIFRVIKYFSDNADVNRVFTFHNSKENKDVYMIALRDHDGSLIGYYEKHESRTLEATVPYADLNN